MIHAFGVLALLFYVTALFVFLSDISSGRAKHYAFGEKLFGLGFVAHSILVILSAISTGAVLPQDKGDFYLLVSWGIVIAYGIVRARMKFPIVGSFFAAAAIMFLASSSYLLHLAEAPDAGIGQGLLWLHVLPALVAELSLIIAVVLSIIFAIQERRLKKKSDITVVLSAPSLDMLSHWTLRLVIWGFIAMSVSIVTGSVWALYYNRSVFTADPFQWMGFLVWILFVLIHLMRSLKGESGRVLSQMTIIAGILLISAMCVFLFSGNGTSHATIYLS